jgi:hypothetical protein
MEWSLHVPCAAFVARPCQTSLQVSLGSILFCCLAREWCFSLALSLIFLFSGLFIGLFCGHHFGPDGGLFLIFCFFVEEQCYSCVGVFGGGGGQARKNKMDKRTF